MEEEDIRETFFDEYTPRDPDYEHWIVDCNERVSDMKEQFKEVL